MEVYEFPVTEQELKTTDGLSVPNKAIVRTDTNRVLGVLGKDYRLVRHKDVLNDMEKAIPTEMTNRKITLCKSGAVMFAKYETPLIKAVEVRKGDIVKFGIEVFNSYDGTLPIGFMFVAMRLVCTNGMTIPKSIARICVRHIGNIDLINAKREFNNRLPLYMKTSDRWQEWAETTPSDSNVDDFFNQTMGKRTKDIFETEYKATSDKSLWGLFNVLTYHNTHNIRMKKNNTENKRLSQVNFERSVLDKFYDFDWKKD